MISRAPRGIRAPWSDGRVERASQPTGDREATTTKWSAGHSERADGASAVFRWTRVVARVPSARHSVVRRVCRPCPSHLDRQTTGVEDQTAAAGDDTTDRFGTGAQTVAVRGCSGPEHEAVAVPGERGDQPPEGGIGPRGVSGAHTRPPLSSTRAAHSTSARSSSPPSSESASSTITARSEWARRRSTNRPASWCESRCTPGSERLDRSGERRLATMATWRSPVAPGPARPARWSGRNAVVRQRGGERPVV